MNNASNYEPASHNAPTSSAPTPGAQTPLAPSNASANASANASTSMTNAPRLPRETIPISNEEAMAGTTTSPSTRSAALGISLMVLALLGAVSMGAWSARRSSQPPVVGPIANRVLDVKPVVVHVAGAVKKPGVYTLKNGARVFDALQKAGGATSQADANALNLAAIAEDGAKIEVPTKPHAPTRLSQKPAAAEDFQLSPEKPREIASDISAVATPELDAALPFASEAAAARLPAKIASKPATSSTRAKTSAPKRQKSATQKPRAKKEKSKTIAGLPRALTPSGELSNNASPEFLKKHPLDLNRITQEQLEALPGVGPSLATRVLEYRKANGGFKSVAELDNVKGIGEKKLEELRPLLRVEGERQAEVQASQKTSNVID